MSKHENLANRRRPEVDQGHMNIEEARLARSPHYLIMLKLYVQPDGGLRVRMGNQTISVSSDEVHALLCGTLDFASVFRKLNEQLSVTTLEILSENNTVGVTNGNQ